MLQLVYHSNKKSHDLKLPDWAEQNFDKVLRLMDFGFYFDYRLPEMAKLTTGTLRTFFKVKITYVE